ncbi:MAG TPA: hypothetical protein VK498_10730 [Ferruginibacter sp.]|nr:hypothetical protein [Ferruginibacter sp.]
MASIYTATIEGWQHHLKDDKYKDVIISILQFLVKSGKVKLYNPVNGGLFKIGRRV